mmetsp:Transcript_922/g.1677  ORF Transcript_922/g.1677 Transcript_922/m.1677 type:complete len:212 (-) Transcript_922:1824-2459(-)
MVVSVHLNWPSISPMGSSTIWMRRNGLIVNKWLERKNPPRVVVVKTNNQPFTSIPFIPSFLVLICARWAIAICAMFTRSPPSSRRIDNQPPLIRPHRVSVVCVDRRTAAWSIPSVTRISSPRRMVSNKLSVPVSVISTSLIRTPRDCSGPISVNEISETTNGASLHRPKPTMETVVVVVVVVSRRIHREGRTRHSAKRCRNWVTWAKLLMS